MLEQWIVMRGWGVLAIVGMSFGLGGLASYAVCVAFPVSRFRLLGMVFSSRAGQIEAQREARLWQRRYCDLARFSAQDRLKMAMRNMHTRSERAGRTGTPETNSKDSTTQPKAAEVVARGDSTDCEQSVAPDGHQKTAADVPSSGALSIEHERERLTGA